MKRKQLLDILSKPIKSIAYCRKFLKFLDKNNISYHLDDDIFEIFNYKKDISFCYLMRDRQNEMFDIDFSKSRYEDIYHLANETWKINEYSKRGQI